MYNQKYLVDNWNQREKIEQVPTRNGFGDGLVEAGKNDDRIVALCADLTESTRIEAFKKEFPDRFIEVGVAEQGLATIASGIANYGKIPFIASYAAFSPGRNWEQIRTTIALNDVPVKIVGAHAGVSVGPDGATHQQLEDIAIMRAMPNMIVLVPADSNETKRATLAAAQIDKPVYIRLAREKSPVFSKPDATFEIGKAILLREGKDITLIACGLLVYEALIASEILEKKGISCEVIDNHTIKPIDKATIIRSVMKTRRAATIEEHQINGGLGGAVAEMLVEEHPVPMKRIGMNDEFGQSGETQQLWDHYGLSAEKIAGTVLSFISPK